MSIINRNLLFFLFLANSISIVGQDLKLMTYNMRLDIAVDGDNAWQYRKDFFVEQLIDYAPDFIGTQEGLPHQIDFIDDELGDYTFIGTSRDGVEKRGEYCAVFYKKEKYETLQSHTFWLSTTPDKPSKGWDAAYIRVCTYGLFKDKKTEQLFWIFNTHLDNEGEKARRKAIRLICKKIKTINHSNHPVILLGDLNTEPDKKIIKRLSRKFIDSKSIDKNLSINTEATFNAFNIDELPTRRIDYIFLDKKNFELKNYRVPRDAKNGKYASDHFPVIVDVRFL